MSSPIQTISPSTNKVILTTPSTSVADAKLIAQRSQDAFKAFRQIPFAERKAIVTKALNIIQERKMDLGRELTDQMGRPIAFSHKEIETMQKRADYLLETAEESLASLPGKEEEGFRRWIGKVPAGPVLIVFAWNVSLDIPNSPVSKLTNFSSPISSLSMPLCQLF